MPSSTESLGPSKHWCLLTTLDMIKARCIECGDCWEWQGGLIGGGHPQVRYKGQCGSARRAVYELSGGRLYQKSFIVTTCENRLCLNPAHLKQMTQAQYMQKLGALGVQGGLVRTANVARGKQAQAGKITMADARQIRQSDEPVKSLAERYGLSPERIYRIRKGTAWREYTNNPFIGLMA